ncbi:MAG: SDR family NAD(P)-dependent oxidoreductase [Pirellulales bacterium]|nr:SDR family NAD(P)-dependent oxidoreductase [Pirellulales bacterium]
MQRSDLFVLTPPGHADPALAIAASRAGARGVLDLEFASGPEAIRAAHARLQQFGTQGYGIKLGTMTGWLADELVATRPMNLRWVILAGGIGPDFAARIGTLQAAGFEVFCEAVSVEEMRSAAAVGAQGLILKGHESGGRIGDETSFILLQRWIKQVAPEMSTPPPVWVQGGIGLNTAPACAVAGAQGVVLDSQVLLAREAAWSESTRIRLENFDGSQTAVLGDEFGYPIRVAHEPRSALTAKLGRLASEIKASAADSEQQRQAWCKAAQAVLSASDAPELRIVGQDATSAAALAQRYVTVGGIVQAVVERVAEHLAIARRLRTLGENSPLAESHRTRYPILQGPMTRVSDTAEFAAAVAEAGGLPFLALALLRKAEVTELLEATRALLGDRSWGAGILGFLPPEIRTEQTAAILATRPPFALIAGGRPDQARVFENEGIPTYLHVPSPALLRMFLKDGARRFVLEGRECGGHVGPRSSFVLWDAACEVLLEHLGTHGTGEDLHVVFAGGIHDGLSGAMVATMAARLAQRGVRVGALLGTAYLFTEEAVACGAIVPRFQAKALDCERTVLLETGTGHAIRCVPTPYCDDFAEEKRKLEQAGRTTEEITRSLEWMNVGRLRVASKGVDRAGSDTAAPGKLFPVAEADQESRGMYMIGQLAALRREVITIAELHAEVSTGAAHLLDRRTTIQPCDSRHRAESPCEVAVIGASCFYPGATSLEQYWNNILRRVYSVTEIPTTHWDWSLYYDPDPMAKDKIISKWGGFLSDIQFDPFRYGITPAAMKAVEPLQLLLLEAVRHALRESGYEQRPFARERTAAICGIGGGGSPIATAYGFRTCMPLIDGVPGMPIRGREIVERCEGMLPEWTEDSFPGFLMNVAVGRVANRFDLGGANYAVDAACASSLAAVQLAVRELQTGASDLALAMGADTVQTPFAYMAFSKTFALSRQGRCRPFDAAADGIVLSEGIGVVVLKRLADAMRDGDQVLAVVRGIGSSSDGREKGLTAPNASGQMRALRRAYEQAGLSPARLGLVEAHGTGTVVGDRTESESLGTFLQQAGATPAQTAVGSVKSMIGHSKCAAGIGGLIKTALALHHKVLPPTLVETPNPGAGFGAGPLYLNTEARPWIHGGAEPRLAGVSAFGFGGTNFHVVLEEHVGDFTPTPARSRQAWDAELIVCRQPTREKLLAMAQHIQQGLSRGGKPRLVDLAASTWRASSTDPGHPTLALVVASIDELRERLPLALQALRGSESQHADPRGIYFAAHPTANRGRVALLFPGQGSQYPNMLADLAISFDCVREAFDAAARQLSGRFDVPLERLIYPPSAFDDGARQQAARDLARTDVAQPALAAASLGAWALWRRLGMSAEMVAGHSFGELTALCAAGTLSPADLLHLAHRRGVLMAAAAGGDAEGLLAVDADQRAVAECLQDLPGVTLANLNSPSQTVISASTTQLEAARASLAAARLKTRDLPVACGFHSPCVASAAAHLAAELREIAWMAPSVAVYSNTTATPYPDEPTRIVERLSEHLAAPVRWIEQVEAMYADGARVFVEVGPQGVLTGLVKQILGERDHVAVATDLRGRSGHLQLVQSVAQLLLRGVPLEVDVLTAGRSQSPFALSDLEKQSELPPPTPSTWIVNGVRARPLNAPEQPHLGQRVTAAQLPAAPSPALTNGTHHPAVKPDSSLTMSPLPNNFPEPPLNTNSPAATNGHAATTGAWTAASADQVADDATLVLCRYQDLMAKFLDTQQALVRDYLQLMSGGPLAQTPLPSVPAAVEMPIATAASAPHVETPSAEAQPVVASAGAAEAAPVEVTREELTRRLLDLVCKRTGYPQEMLDLDLDLEADLGVDSIKRVEILGTLAESLGGKESELGGRLELEKLTVLRTLRGILDYLAQHVLTPQTAGTNGSAASHPETNGKSSGTNGTPRFDATAHRETGELAVQRAVVELIDAPLPGGAAPLIPSGTVVITDDQRGIARHFASRLADFGQQVVLVRMVPGAAAVDEVDGIYRADLADAEQVEALAERLRNECGTIGGLVHLAPLAAQAGDVPLTEQIYRDVKSTYLLARTLEDDLVQAGANGSSLLLVGASLGGQLGFEQGPLSEHFRAGHGGILGLLKCIAQEWDAVLVRAVDVDLARDPEELAEALLAELSDREGPVEIGISDRRVTWKPASAPLIDLAADDFALPQGAKILITGGARGITAKVAVELARHGQPHLVLVGRTALPSDDEPTELQALTEPAELKRALIQRLEAAGQPATPKAVEREHRQLLAAREIRATLAEIAAAGATWEYHALDVRDIDAFGRLIDQLNATGGVQGVVHGAGVIEDKLLRDKTPESFDRVFRTKVDSALVLAERLDPTQLKFCVLFSSLASRYGNRGQSDYAAANEVLSKLAAQLDRRWPGRVCAIAWGPWSGVGMVAELEPHLVRRGLKLITPAEGPRFVLAEIATSEKGPCEVVIAGGAEHLVRPRKISATAAQNA